MFQLMKVLNGDPFIDYDDSEMTKNKIKNKISCDYHRLLTYIKESMQVLIVLTF